MNYAVFDIDNCLSNDAWRIKFIDWTQADADERYRPYHLRCYGDEPQNLHVVADAMTRGDVPVFFTARPEEVRELTRMWLNAQLLLLVNPLILMRQAREFVPSVQLKGAMLARFRADLGAHDRIVGAYDDRPDIVAMYRAAGIASAEVLKIHDVCAYTNPLTQEKPYGQ